MTLAPHCTLINRLKRLLPALGLCLLAMGLTGDMGAGAYDKEELGNMSVYENASPAVVSVMVQTTDGPSTGTGFIISPDGLMVTSQHVIGESRFVKVTRFDALNNEQVFQAQVIGKSAGDSDLAVLQIKTNAELPYLSLVPFGNVRVGQKVFAIGNPYGFERTLPLGIVSRLDLKKRRIQTDASINPGSSGGPLLNSEGQVIGISQSIYNPDGNRSNIGIGFAVPCDEIRHYLAAKGRPVETTAELNTGTHTIPVRHTPYSRRDGLVQTSR
ncbi:MAG: trypsin-like peptidase domain-containing protein [Cyanobacteria bacterium HKST-UBA06]|nr:trypsin-like peptidase domain-containing protein [Cyanobacteria bacterium HKST-UBA06]